MRRTQADRRAEAARAQQMTEQAQRPTFEEWTDQYVADNIHKLKAPLVQDRKTGEFYNPKEAFDKLMNTPEVLASLKRLSIR